MAWVIHIPEKINVRFIWNVSKVLHIFAKQLTTHTMKILTKEQIIETFRLSFIAIKVSDCKKADRGMIVTIHPNYGLKLFPTYWTAYNFYFSKKM